MLKPLTDAKNIIQRHHIEVQIAETGNFDKGVVPYDTACITCSGAGELYRFFRDTVVEPCKVCDGKGKRIVTCHVCKGASRYTKHEKEVNAKQKGADASVECDNCIKDKNGKPTGKEEVRCWKCHGTKKVRRFVLAPKIKSTTHCRDCKGRGFTLPEPPPKIAKKEILINPVIQSDMGALIKSAKVEE